MDVLLIRPFACDITGALHPGSNTIEVAVTSSKVTHYDHIPWPSGLCGQVTLECYEK